MVYIFLCISCLKMQGLGCRVGVICCHFSFVVSCLFRVCRCWPSDVLLASKLHERSVLSVPTGDLWRYRQEGRHHLED